VPRPKLWVSWSSGKDSAWTLHLLRQSGEFEISGLLTSLNRNFNRVAMHGTRRALLEAQAKSAGVPLHVVELPWPCSNDDYECAMRSSCDLAVVSGVEYVAFGDLFLEDIRAYRESQLRPTGLKPLFPLWQRPTRELAMEMVAAGLKAKLACVDTGKLPRGFAGRDFGGRLLAELPAAVDPCGENGEFHTAVYAGPMFQNEISVSTGEIVDREQFVYADVVPSASSGDEVGQV
jgi:uncharacterized protein (TIGR00290 family)